jgi:spore germination protein YaaH
VQTAGGVRLFLLASTDSSFDAFQRNYQHVSTIYPTYYDCNTSTGATVGRDDPRITRWAMARGVKVQPRYNCQSPSMVHKLVSEPLRRQALVASLTGLVDANGYDGINLDLEKGLPTDRDNLSALVAELSAALHARGRHLSIDVSPKVTDVLNHPRSSFFDYPALALHADEVLVMSWGLHWTTSAPGSVIDIRWYTMVYDYVSSLADHAKFVMGAPLYGVDWPAGGGPAHPASALNWDALQALIARTGAVPVFDAPTAEWHFTYTDATGVPHEVWFSDAASLNTHLALAAPRGLAGIALWRAGQEDPAIWDAPAIRGTSP